MKSRKKGEKVSATGCYQVRLGAIFEVIVAPQSQ